MVNGTDVLKWLREILICRNKFLLKNKVQQQSGWEHSDQNGGFHDEPTAAPSLQESATMGGGIPICRQAQTKLEVCLYMFLWSPDTEAVLVAMSCFRHLCEEADIRSAADEVPVQSILPNYATFSELASVSNMMGTGRSTLQKRVMALLRRVEHPTPGNIEVSFMVSMEFTSIFGPFLPLCWFRLQAWEETYSKWDQATKQILNSPKNKADDGQVSLLRRPGLKRQILEMSPLQSSQLSNMAAFIGGGGA